MGIWSSHIANEEDGFFNNPEPTIQEEVITLRLENKHLRIENEQLKSRLKKAKEMLPAYLSEKV